MWLLFDFKSLQNYYCQSKEHRKIRLESRENSRLRDSCNSCCSCKENIETKINRGFISIPKAENEENEQSSGSKGNVPYPKYSTQLF